MSSLPFHKSGSADSSNTISTQITPKYPDHGAVPPPPSQQHQHEQPQPQPRHDSNPASLVQSIRIFDPPPFSPVQSSNFLGSVSPPADSCDEGSSAKVNEQEKQQSYQRLHQDGGKILHQARPETTPRQTKSSKSTVILDAHQMSAAAALTGATSTSSSGRKTQMVSGNHLLNFHFDPISRPLPRPWIPPPRRQHRRKPYNKDLFLQANYKFVMLDSGNYAPESMDPDKMLLWEDIICLKYFTPFQVNCPICLDDPLCPQITSCGHIFCFPCVLHYLMLGGDDSKDEFSKKCPLCFMMISSQDMFTVSIKNVKQYHVGDAIEFWLLSRHKDSFVLSLKDTEGINLTDEVQDSFSKFTFTSDVDMSVREAMSDLDSWLAKVDSGLVDDLEKLPYVCAAIKLLEQRKNYWNERQVSNGYMARRCGSVPETFSGSPEAAKLSNVASDASESAWGSPSNSVNGQLVWLHNSAPDKLPSLTETSVLPESLDNHDTVSSAVIKDTKNIKTPVDGCIDGKGRDVYNFYQAVDGQNLILHPLNMKCLLHHYGSYDRLPNRIAGKILQMESLTQSETVRRRFRYLSHMSLTATFQFCEIDLTEMLPAEALSPFMDEISNREKLRKRLSRKEHREKIKAEAAGVHFTPVTLNLEQNFHDESPTFSMDDFEALGSSATTSSSPQKIGERQSFSNVARLGFAAGHDSPALNTDSDPLLKMEASRDPSGSIDARNSRGPSFASVTSRGKPPEKAEGGAEVNKMGKKGKKPSRVLLSTSGARRY